MNAVELAVDPIITFVYPAIFGLIYGYLVFGSPLLPRRDVISLMGPGTMAGIMFLLVRNLTSPRGTPLHVLAWILFTTTIWLGTLLRRFFESRFPPAPRCPPPE